MCSRIPWWAFVSASRVCVGVEGHLMGFGMQKRHRFSAKRCLVEERMPLSTGTTSKGLVSWYGTCVADVGCWMAPLRCS